MYQIINVVLVKDFKKLLILQYTKSFVIILKYAMILFSILNQEKIKL